MFTLHTLCLTKDTRINITSITGLTHPAPPATPKLMRELRNCSLEAQSKQLVSSCCHIVGRNSINEIPLLGKNPLHREKCIRIKNNNTPVSTSGTTLAHTHPFISSGSVACHGWTVFFTFRDVQVPLCR